MCHFDAWVVLDAGISLVPTVYPKKYTHGFVVLCFVVVMQSFIMNSHEVFIHIHQGCFAGTGAIVRLPQCQWSKPDGYGKISQCITTTKHSKAKTVCIFLGIYCTSLPVHLQVSVHWFNDLFEVSTWSFSGLCLWRRCVSFVIIGLTYQYKCILVWVYHDLHLSLKLPIPNWDTLLPAKRNKVFAYVGNNFIFAHNATPGLKHPNKSRNAN